MTPKAKSRKATHQNKMQLENDGKIKQRKNKTKNYAMFFFCFG